MELPLNHSDKRGVHRGLAASRLGHLHLPAHALGCAALHLRVHRIEYIGLSARRYKAEEEPDVARVAGLLSPPHPQQRRDQVKQGAADKP